MVYNQLSYFLRMCRFFLIIKEGKARGVKNYWEIGTGIGTGKPRPGSGSGLENPKIGYPSSSTRLLPGYREPGFAYYLIIFIYYYFVHLGLG
jgi:hypothetical protein